MPHDSWVKGTTESRNPDRWDMKTELLAKLVEVSSVSATEKTRLKKPIDLPRPWDGKRGDGTQGVKILQTTQTRVKVLTAGPTTAPPVRTKKLAGAGAQ